MSSVALWSGLCLLDDHQKLIPSKCQAAPESELWRATRIVCFALQDSPHLTVLLNMTAEAGYLFFALSGKNCHIPQ